MQLKEHDRPMPWNFAIMCFNVGRFYGYRSEANTIQYIAERELNNETWKDIESIIKHDVFNMRKEVDVLGSGLFHVQQPLEGNARRLMPNKYPYHYEAGVANWVLWFGKENATNREMIGWIEGYHELDDFDLIVYENPMPMKSVKGIRHLQILARRTMYGQRRKIYFHSNNEEGLN